MIVFVFVIQIGKLDSMYWKRTPSTLARFSGQQKVMLADIDRISSFGRSVGPQGHHKATHGLDHTAVCPDAPLEAEVHLGNRRS